MKNKFTVLIIVVLILTAFSYLLWRFPFHSGPKTLPAPKINLQKVPFSKLPGWGEVDLKKSLLAFKISCKAFLKQDPNKAVGSAFIPLRAKDWYPACKRAQSIDSASKKAVRNFFQSYFQPMAFIDPKPIEGLFTGYYMPLLQGSLKRTEKYNVPLYGLPNNLVSIDLNLFDSTLGNRTLMGRVEKNKVVPYYTREEINKGAIDSFSPVIAWVDNTIDRSFLEIQGSGLIQLENGKRIAVGYIGENGASYTAIAKVLMDQGVMTKDNASMQHIRSYLEAHPEQIDKVLNQNKSFVFFNTLATYEALGAQGVALTPGYSLAVDHKWVPYGTPIWLNTTRPAEKSEKNKMFHRLMVAQDTGGAIKGTVRGDVYWGAGDRATTIAGRMKNRGYYWLLLPLKSGL